MPRSDLHGQHLGMKRHVEKIKCKERSTLKCQRKQEKEAHFNHKTGFAITEIKKADTGMSPAK